jgi:hypothetical protein
MREPHRRTRRFAVTYYPGDVAAAEKRVCDTDLHDASLGFDDGHAQAGNDAVETKYAWQTSG